MAQNAVIYTRLSAQREGDTETLADQESVCRRIAETKGQTVVEVFAEGAGVSAYSGAARPALDKLHEHVRASLGSAVVAWELSRLTRRLNDLSGWIDLIDECSLRIITTSLDTAEGGLLMLTVMSAHAHEESATKSSRVRDGKRRQRAAGRLMSSRTPTGYVLSTEIKGGLEMVPVAAEVMREAVRLYVDERSSLRATAAALNAAGHRTRLGNMFKGSTNARRPASTLLRKI